MLPPISDLKALFLDALERPAGADRAAFLNEACKGDAFLRAQVEALLMAHEEAGEFLASSAGTEAGAESIPPPGLAATQATAGPSAGRLDETASIGEARDPAGADLAATTTRSPDPTAAATSPATTAGPRPLTERPGDTIGPYTLL